MKAGHQFWAFQGKEVAFDPTEEYSHRVLTENPLPKFMVFTLAQRGGERLEGSGMRFRGGGQDSIWVLQVAR